MRAYRERQKRGESSNVVESSSEQENSDESSHYDNTITESYQGPLRAEENTHPDTQEVQWLTADMTAFSLKKSASSLVEATDYQDAHDKTTRQPPSVITPSMAEAEDYRPSRSEPESAEADIPITFRTTEVSADTNTITDKEEEEESDSHLDRAVHESQAITHHDTPLSSHPSSIILDEINVSQASIESIAAQIEVQPVQELPPGPEQSQDCSPIFNILHNISSPDCQCCENTDSNCTSNTASRNIGIDEAALSLRQLSHYWQEDIPGPYKSLLQQHRIVLREEPGLNDMSNIPFSKLLFRTHAKKLSFQASNLEHYKSITFRQVYDVDSCIFSLTSLAANIGGMTISYKPPYNRSIRQSLQVSIQVVQSVGYSR